MHVQAPWKLVLHVAVSCLVWALDPHPSPLKEQEAQEHLGTEWLTVF